jgi:hypothetical protein
MAGQAQSLSRTLCRAVVGARAGQQPRGEGRGLGRSAFLDGSSRRAESVAVIGGLGGR